jgi:hypothetical protein
MANTTLSSRELIRTFASAAQAADMGPVFVRDLGVVVLSFAGYQRLIQEHRNMAELLSVSDLAAETDFDPPRSIETVKAADFS